MGIHGDLYGSNGTEWVSMGLNGPVEVMLPRVQGDLCNKNDAVIMATGATQWRDMRSTENRQLGNVVQAPCAGKQT